MNSNYVNKMVYKNNTVSLIIGLIITLIVINITKTSCINIYNFFCGPFDMELENLFSISKLEDTSYRGNYINHPLHTNHYIYNNKFFYKLQGNESIKTGVEDVNDSWVDFYGFTHKIEPVDISEYFLLKIKERLLVVRAPVNSSDTKFSGIILPLSKGVRDQIKINLEDTSLDEKLLPFILDATGNYKKDFYYQLAITIVLFAFLIIYCYRIIIRFVSARRHPLYKKIGIYGPKEEIAESIHREIMDHENSYVDGKYIRTTNWNIKKSLLRPDITKNYRKKED